MHNKNTFLDRNLYLFIWVSIAAMLCFYSAIGLMP